MNNPRKTSRRLQAFSLLELILALVLIALLSTAVATQLTGASNTYQFVNGQMDNMSQVEMAYRRMLHNVRAASAITAPANTTAATSFTVVTQPDPSNANATYSVTYALSGTNLTETDPRYNGGSPTVLVSNVSSFSVTRQSMTAPTTFLITITVGSTPPVTRSVTIYCRNL